MRLCLQDYYSIPFATPTTALTGREGSLTNNPYSGEQGSLWNNTRENVEIINHIDNDVCALFGASRPSVSQGTCPSLVVVTRHRRPRPQH